MNKEVQQLDWTANGGGRVSKDTFFDPANGLSDYHDDLEDIAVDAQWHGGTFVLGGGSNSNRIGGDSSTLTTRELVARAAQLRQIESEKDEDGLCGAKRSDAAKP